MSVIHIGFGGTVVCGRTQVRGVLTPDEFKKLHAEGRIRKQNKVRIQHGGCARRPCGCARREEIRSAMCKDCTR